MIGALAGAQAAPTRGRPARARVRRGDELTTDERGRVAVDIAAAKLLAAAPSRHHDPDLRGHAGRDRHAWGFDRFWRKRAP